MNDIIAHRSNTPTYSYYKQEYAESLAPLIEAMIADGKDRSFVAAKFYKSVNTFHTYVNRALLYLVDHLDTTDKRYARFKRSVKISKKDKEGRVEILWKVPRLQTNVWTAETRGELIGTLATEPVIKITTNNTTTETKLVDKSKNWNETLDDFICSEAVGMLEIRDIELDSEEVSFVKISVLGLNNIKIIQVDKNNIVLEKV